jgi:hypothetical protein
MSRALFLLPACMAFLPLMVSCSFQSEKTMMKSDSLPSQALTELRHNLKTLEKWEKVHAAEYLIWALRALLNNVNPLNGGNLKNTQEVIGTAENADVRSAAAYAILKIDRREK